MPPEADFVALTYYGDDPWPKTVEMLIRTGKTCDGLFLTYFPSDMAGVALERLKHMIMEESAPEKVKDIVCLIKNFDSGGSALEDLETNHPSPQIRKLISTLNSE